MGMTASSDREILKKMCWLERHSRHISHTAITSDSTTAVKLKVIASGGVSGLGDIKELKQQASCGIEGVIVGKAIYTGNLDLTTAIAYCKE